MKINFNYSIPFIDQAIVSGCSFLITLIIIKISNVTLFGEFSFIWIINYFLLSFQNSFLTSPLFSLYPKISNLEKNKFITNLFILEIFFIIICSILIFFFSNSFVQIINLHLETKTLFLIILSINAFQLQNFIKRCLYCQKSYKSAFLSNITSYSLLLSLIFFLYFYNNEINLDTIFISYFVSFLLGSVFFLKKINFVKTEFLYFSKHFFLSWEISKWLTLGNFFYWFTSNFWFVLSGYMFGSYTFGILRSLANLANIFNIFYQSLENIIPQKTSEFFSDTNKEKMKDFLIKFTKIGSCFGLILLTLIIIFGKQVTIFLFDQDVSQYFIYLYYFSIINFFQFYTYPVNYGLRTLNYTKPNFYYYMISSIFSLIFGSVFLKFFDIYGFFIGIFISNLIVLLGTFFNLFRAYKNIT